MIARTKGHAGQSAQPELRISLDVNLNGLDGMKGLLMELLSHATIPPSETRPRWHSDDEETVAELTTTTTAKPPEIPPADVQLPPAEPSEPTAGPLRTAYDTLLLPRKSRSVAKKTVKDQQSSADLFDSWLAEEWNPRSATPGVSALASEPDLFIEFARFQFTRHGNSAHTINRRLIQIKMIADAMLKDGQLRSLKADRLSLTELKRIRRECVDTKAEPERIRIPSRAQIDLLAKSTGVASYPFGEHAPEFWSGWIRFASLFGPRSCDVVSYVKGKPGLRQCDVIRDTVCPVADVNNALGYDLHSPHGWLHYYVGKDHTSDTPRVLFPMPAWCRKWIDDFSQRSAEQDPTGRVFPCGASKQSFKKAWRLILKAAGVDQRIRISEGSGNAIAIRKAAANWWNLQTKSAEVADYVLHHKTVTVSAKHYLSVQASVLPRMIELLPTFEPPGIMQSDMQSDSAEASTQTGD
ncbi:MAG: hypothetical protein Fues2KO_45510 [Fuerstiella sp.]